MDIPAPAPEPGHLTAETRDLSKPPTFAPLHRPQAGLHFCTLTRPAPALFSLSFAILSFPFSLPTMPKPDKNDIERLSRGESTRGKIGNRGVGHRLTQKERILFEAAKRNGFLKIPVTGIRKNVLNVYRLWCQATDREFITK